nr:aspartate 1-decarboxylase [Desulfobacterales bacterium]
MLRTFLKSKIHRATITGSDLHYEGSLTIDIDLMRAANILPHEMVHVYNISNGERFTTYALEGASGSGIICLNGAAARKGQKGDLIIITTYALLDEKEIPGFKPLMIYVDNQNKIKGE